MTYVEHNQNGGLLVESPDEREAPLADLGNEPWPLLAPPDLSTLGGSMLPSSSLFIGTDADDDDDDDDFMGDPAGAFALVESAPEWRADAASTPMPSERLGLSSSFLPSGLSLGAPRTLSDSPESRLTQPEVAPAAVAPESPGGGTPTTIRAAPTFVPLTFADALEPQPSRAFPATACAEHDAPADVSTVATAHDAVVADHDDSLNATPVVPRKRFGTLFAKVDPSASVPAENPRRARTIRILAGTSLALGLMLGGYTFVQTKSKTTTPATVVSETTPTTAIGSDSGGADSGDLEFGNGGDFSFSDGGDFTVK